MVQVVNIGGNNVSSCFLGKWKEKIILVFSKSHACTSIWIWAVLLLEKAHENSLAEKDLGGMLVDERPDGCELKMCAYSPESPPYPGLHQTKQGQPVEAGDPDTVPFPGET